ncbi:hypothetical protein O181_117392 [Austropuccinia psidii MF-1]|uniref:Uncharacterized protein n=1 Tax=Austropuccinia psidii MF-1 TaxID=1389203 RepID=A0A9Q3KB57_9BASI|nr:hypothetical protein [Austropuccinia psidii MF-1]
MKSPTSTLRDQHCLLELETDLNRLVPFGIKVTTKIISPSSKIEPRGEILWELTFEKYSDGLWLINLETGKISVSQDFNPTAVNPTLSMNQKQQVIPTTSSLTVKLQIPTSQFKKSVIEKDENPMITHPRSNVPFVDSSQVGSSTQKSKHYDYVPYYKEAPKNISSSISQDNIVLGKRNARDSNKLILEDVVPYTQAISNPLERKKWQKAMGTKFNSLVAHNTGELVLFLPISLLRSSGVCGDLLRNTMNMEKSINTKLDGLF